MGGYYKAKCLRVRQPYQRRIPVETEEEKVVYCMVKKSKETTINHYGTYQSPPPEQIRGLTGVNYAHQSCRRVHTMENI